jgi:hypothetical protein
VIRVALAAVLLVAIAGVGVQAIETGRHDRTVDRLDAATERLTRAARLLSDRDDPTVAEVPGARRVVAVWLPERALASAPADSFVVDGADDRVVYRVRGGRPRRTHVPVDLRTPDGPVTLGGPGRYRLVLELVAPPRPGVAVTRADPGVETR